MSVDHIEVLVEEPSMEAAMRLLLPHIVGECCEASLLMAT